LYCTIDSLIEPYDNLVLCLLVYIGALWRWAVNNSQNMWYWVTIMDKCSLLVIILQMCIICTEDVQYSVSIYGFTLMECENSHGEWLLLSRVSISHVAICNTCTDRKATLLWTFIICKTGLKSMSKGGNGILIVSLHKNNFSSNLYHYKFAYFLFGSQTKLLA